jgi:hypothetical protein
VVVAAVKEIGKWIGAVNLWLGREKLHLSLTAPALCEMKRMREQFLN